MTDTTVENTPAVDVQVESAPIIASLDHVSDEVGFAVTLFNKRAKAFNALALSNAASSLSVDDLKTKIAETFSNEELDKINEAIAKAMAAKEKALAKADAEITAKAEAAKAAAGEPDTIGENAAAKKVTEARNVLTDMLEAESLPANAVDHFLEDLSKTSTRRSIAAKADTGPKQDIGAVRDWGRANGFEVKDRGRLNDDLVAAFNAANPDKAIVSA